MQTTHLGPGGDPGGDWWMTNDQISNPQAGQEDLCIMETIYFISQVVPPVLADIS